ncbi:hypothetical protein M432DRAFT_148038 [Thermoascus aurantiacus ATCC 26904]
MPGTSRSVAGREAYRGLMSSATFCSGLVASATNYPRRSIAHPCPARTATRRPLLLTAPDWRSVAKEIRASWCLAQTLSGPGSGGRGSACYPSSFRTAALTSSTGRPARASVGRADETKQAELSGVTDAQVWTRKDSQAIPVAAGKATPSWSMSSPAALQIASNPRPMELVSDGPPPLLLS